MKARIIKGCFLMFFISIFIAGCGVNSNETDDNKDQNSLQEEQFSAEISSDEETENEEEIENKEETDYDEKIDEREGVTAEESDEQAMQEEQQNSDQDVMAEDSDSTEVVINTEYIPVAYRQNALIVQRSEDIELYGLLDAQGNTVIEPEYDKLEFKFMNGKDYIKATLAGNMGILDLDGKECIEMGLYDDIASAGDAGWLHSMAKMPELKAESNIC